MGRFLRWCALLSAATLLTTLALQMIVHQSVAGRIVDKPDALPIEHEPRVAIVFGAGLHPDGSATPILYDRVATAAELYQQGRVNKLLLSGDNRTEQHNEPLAMARVALSLGVPRDALVPDYAGRRTYDSCYRAKEIFDVTRAVIVTQRFHLDRATYLCSMMGIDSLAVAADRQNYGNDSYTFWTLREYPSTLEAILDVNFLHPMPVLGEKIPIE